MYNDVQQMCILFFFWHAEFYVLGHSKCLRAWSCAYWKEGQVFPKHYFGQHRLLSLNQGTLEPGVVGAVCNYPTGLRSDR